MQLSKNFGSTTFWMSAIVFVCATALFMMGKLDAGQWTIITGISTGATGLKGVAAEMGTKKNGAPPTP